ncbi:LysR family transcriptional regulator [Pseudomonas brassicacearum]|uniref:LysR family transcriptional regulator n=1 Tax=Pseudomonas brassicacearum TaxID=930166 RepID=A0A423J6R2_9PSED|nr:LysR family transcriptional regulator [Pseudomonas brassicacearum]RON33344.1 LysR family transcriptional regulator [Pseudomonas brassicacearum]
MESLNAIGVFVAAAEARSFVGAGRALGISASAVSKSIARLEAKFGVRLFHRSTRSITLTAEGTQFVERCRRVLAELEVAGEELSQNVSVPQGPLRISLPMIAKPFLSIFGKFQSRYPDIQLDLEFTDRLTDVITEGFDAVIRSGAPKDSGLSARPLGTYRMLTVGSAAYLARKGTPQSPEDLHQHACIHFRFPQSGKLQTWPFKRDDQAVELELPRSMICNSVEGRMDLAVQGLGITYAADFVVREALADGRLVEVLEDFTGETGQFNLLWPSGRQVPPKLRVFIEFVAAYMPLTRSQRAAADEGALSRSAAKPS